MKSLLFSILTVLFAVNIGLSQIKIQKDVIPLLVGNTIRHDATIGGINPSTNTYFDNIGDYKGESVTEQIKSKTSFSDSKRIWKTNMDSINGRSYTVLAIIDTLEVKFIHLSDIKTKKNIFYKIPSSIINSYFPHNIPFTTNNVNYTDEYFKNHIDKVVDDFTDEIKINSPIFDDMCFIKIVKVNKTVDYYLRLTTSSYSVNVLEKGVIILFTDNTKLNKPNVDIDIKASSYGYNYSAFIPLTLNDLKLLKTKKIKKYRLYIHDEDVDSEDSEKFNGFVNYISKINK